MTRRVPEEEDSFIGSTFGVGGHLLVVGWNGKTQTHNKVYQVRCSVCARDEGLFGDGIFNSIKSSLVRGQIPCACAKKFYWNAKQALLRATRAASKIGYEVLGWAEEWRGSDTKVKLRCQSGHVWDKRLSNLLKGTGCQHCRWVNNGLMNADTENEVLRKIWDSGKFAEGSVFTKVPGEPSNSTAKWQYTCGKCSTDEKVQSGACSGIFNSVQYYLISGQTACRCYTGGYKKHLPAHLYVVMVSDGSYRYTGYGITNNLVERKHTHDRELLKDGFAVEGWEVFETTGQLAWDIEAAVQRKFEIVPQKTRGFRTEATHWYNYEEVLDFVESMISQEQEKQ